MATLAEIQAAAKLKREKNLTPAQAVAEVRASSVPPAPTPVTPTPVTPAPIAQPIDQQTVQGVNGETFKVAPVNAEGVTPQTPAPQPTQPTPVTPTETTPPSPTPTIDKSAEIKAQNEAQMALNAQKSQLAIQERKQAEADAKLASIPTDQKGITNSLISGMSVAPQNTQAYRNAVTVSEQFKKFNGMTDVQLLDNLKQGQIGTELDSLLSQNPNYAKAKAELAKAQKTASINRATQIASNVISGKENVTEDDLTGIEAKYNAPPGTNADAYQAYVVQNPDVVSAGLQLKSLSTQISNVTKSYNDALKSIKEQYGDMPASALLTLMQSRTKDTKELLDSYINAKELAKGDFDMAMKMAEGSYEAYGKDLANQQEIDKEQRTMKNSVALSQMQFDQKIAQQAQAMNDPTQAINSVISQYADQGIFASKSVQEHIDAFKEQNAKYGTTLGEYISQMQKDFQAKDSYKAKFAPKTDVSPYQTMSLGDGKALMYNQTTGEYEIIGANGQPTSSTSGYYSTFRVSQDYGAADTPNSKDVVLLANGKKGTPGIDFVMPENTPVMSTVTGKVTFVGPRGDYGNQVEITDSQGNRHMFSHMNGANVGFGDKIQAGQQLGLSGNTGFSTGAHLDYRVKSTDGKWVDPKSYINQGQESYDKAKLPLYAKYNNGDMTATDWKTIGELGTSKDQFIQQATASKTATDSAGAQFAQEVIDLANSLKTDDGRLSASLGGARIPRTDANAYKAKFDAFKSKLALKNLTDLKAQGATFGALSNQELHFLESSASSLNLSQPDAAYQAELDRIIQKLQKAITPNTSVSTPALTPEQIKSKALEMLNSRKKS